MPAASPPGVPAAPAGGRSTPGYLGDAPPGSGAPKGRPYGSQGWSGTAGSAGTPGIGGAGRWLAGPTALAAVATLLNAAKPAAVDDTAYLLFADHLSRQPLDPYGFDIYWYARPDPAMSVLLPPVLPYWAAGGVALFGHHLFLVKLWLFPFALIFAHALGFLLRRFAPGWDRPMLALTVVGPAVLPTFGLMLDVPAVGLGLAAVAAFVAACDRGKVGWAALSGLLMGLAAQTKYTMLTVPAVVAWYGLLNRRPALAAAAVAVAAGGFGGWEAAVAARYGHSHFLVHAADQRKSAGRDGEMRGLPKWRAVLRDKARLFQPMLGQLGGLGLGVGVAAAAAHGVPRRRLAAGLGAAGLGLAAVFGLPADAQVLVPGKLDLPTLVFVALGAATGAGVLAAVGRLLAAEPTGRDTWFVAGWLAVELAGYFALTPFPAGRRVIGLAVVGGLIAARLAGRRPADRRPGGWVAAVGVGWGLTLFAVDCWDAYPEKVLAERAAEAAGGGPGVVWYHGHWGFQYYCQRLGMRPVIPGETVLRAGDRLAYPTLPDGVGFYRPYHGGVTFAPDRDFLSPVADVVWDDRLAARTIPELYGGNVPVRGRGHPRLRVAVYRVTGDWVPPAVRPWP